MHINHFGVSHNFGFKLPYTSCNQRIKVCEVVACFNFNFREQVQFQSALLLETAQKGRLLVNFEKNSRNFERDIAAMRNLQNVIIFQ